MSDKTDLLLEFYKTAYSRLNFQDEYLFRISAMFLAVHGGLAILLGEIIDGYSMAQLFIVCTVGFSLAIVWALWVRHNDYWHSVWSGTLRRIEKDLERKNRVHLVKVFHANHKRIARAGRRSDCCMPRGHTIALITPIIISLAWAGVLIVTVCKCG